MAGTRQAILETLLYSDIFDYSLTKEEIWKFLIGKKISRESFEKALKTLTEDKATPLGRKYQLYYLLGREKIIKKRIGRKKTSQEKIDLAKKIISFFNFLPTVQLVGISGALSLRNCDKDDDIDLFVIAKKNNLWLTRFIMIVFLKIIGRYRSYSIRDFSDKICLNMLIDEKALSFPKKRQNLYTAHEIVQILPILNKNNTYGKFLSANAWIKKFLPNSLDIKKLSNRVIEKKKPTYQFTQLLNYPLTLLEWIAKKIQLTSINKHKSTETISDNFLAFHPFDYKEKVLEEYKRRLKKYEI